MIDFDLPSIAERMYVVDLKNITVNTYLVAHGKESGDLYATSFSNEINSNKALWQSITGTSTSWRVWTFHGSSGREASNNNAETREIVLHGADYVSYDFIKQTGRLAAL